MINDIKRIDYYFLLIIPYIEPQLFKTAGFDGIDTIFLVLKLICAMLISIEYIIVKKFKISRITILMFISQSAVVLSTILNNGSMKRCLGPAIISIVMIMLGELVFSTYWKNYLIILEKYLDILFLVHCITLILRFLGVNPFYTNRASFLGIENRWIYVFLPWVIISFINSYVKIGKISFKAVMTYLCCLFCLLITWSVGAFLSFIIFPVIMYLSRKVLSRINIKTFVSFVAFGVFNYVLVTGKLLKFFENFIVGYLHKSITLSGRVYLWEVVLKCLSEKPLLGEGVHSTSYDLLYFYQHSGCIPGTAVNHPHNHLLNIAFHGGYFALVFFYDYNVYRLC
ncbi:O-antigen ligase family protein [Ruminococcus sp. HUN007]|uniref:O-antigen ligase family protein n=1 Tax=Ruminococcus sp. HUN007 TaxID=1514668 RepID=UPI0005D26A51|nr:O-antigen ligase family protein [Ruminococcus sp. HUN007]